MPVKEQKSTDIFLSDYKVKIGDVEFRSLHPEVKHFLKNEPPTYKDLLHGEHLFEFDKINEGLDKIVSDEAQDQIKEMIRFMLDRRISYIRAVVS